MRRGIVLIAILLSLGSCTKENFLRLTSNSATKGYIPKFSSPKSYRSNDGDTIFLRKISEDNYFEKSPQTGSDNGYLGEFDYIEVERTNLVVGSDTPYFRVHIDLTTRYNATQVTRSDDKLTFTLDEENNAGVQQMEFVYTDSLSCVSERCAHEDTFKLQLRTFYDVYYNPRDNAIIPALYINKQKGLVGFKTTDNKIYELISP